MQRLAVRASVLFVSLVAAALIFPATAQAIPYPVAIDSTNFPDATWRGYANTNFAGGDYILTQTEAEAVTSVSVVNRGITDLTGIEYFVNTTNLDCAQNSLTFLDLTGLASLQKLDCRNNALTSLDVAGLTGLQRLSCQRNALTSLNLAGLTGLQRLNCDFNSLTSLDVADLVNLESLTCAFNSLTSLDATGLASLIGLNCEVNALTSLNVTGLANLQNLSFANNFLTSLDTTGLTSLQWISGDLNSLLDVVGELPKLTFAGRSQTRTIPMRADPSGGFVSVCAYSIAPGHVMGGLDAGVTFGADGRFHMPTFIAASLFETDLANNGFTVKGTLTFELLSTYTVTFLDWDGTLLGRDSVISGNSATAPSDPAREGYTFLGWDTDFTNITGDTTIVALYEGIPVPLPPSTPASGKDLAPAGDMPVPVVSVLLGAIFAGVVLAAVHRKAYR